MKNIHLSEDQLQQYSLGVLTDAELVAHTVVCPSCQLQVKAYQLLIKGVKEMEEPVLEFNLEELVLSQLPVVVAPANKDRTLYFILLAPIVLLAVMGIIFQEIFTYLFTETKPVILALTIVFFIGIAIIQLNHHYQSYRKKMNTLSYL
jgi:hypothetical protein